MLAICVWHVDPDNIAYVGPFSAEEAREAMKNTGFTHEEAQEEQEEAWVAQNIGGSKGVRLTIVDWSRVSKSSPIQPDDLVATIFGE